MRVSLCCRSGMMVYRQVLMTLRPISTSRRRSSMASHRKPSERADRCAISARPYSFRKRRRAGIGRHRSSVVMRAAWV